MNRIYQGKVTVAEISALRILSASIPFYASDGETPLAHRMEEGGRRSGDGPHRPDEVSLESGERGEGEKQNPGQQFNLDVCCRHDTLFQDLVN